MILRLIKISWRNYHFNERGGNNHYIISIQQLVYQIKTLLSIFTKIKLTASVSWGNQKKLYITWIYIYKRTEMTRRHGLKKLKHTLNLKYSNNMQIVLNPNLS